MYETQTTVRGTIITDPVTRRVGDDEVFSFRVASNTRYQDRTTGEWKTGGTLYFSANCWGKLVPRTSGRLFKGDAVIVQGRLLTNEYEKEGRVMRDLEMRVGAIGPDMARMDVTAKKVRHESNGPDAGDGGVRGADGLRAVDGPDAEAMAVGSVPAGGHPLAAGLDSPGLRGLDDVDSDLEDEDSELEQFAGASTA